MRLVRANKSPRYQRLEGLESWVTCDQYRGRPSWWTDKVPQWEREPCIVYPIVRSAISSNVDLMLGERAFPRLTFTQEVEDAGDSEDQIDTEAALADLHRVARFKTTCREAFAAGQAMGSACAVYGVRDGRPFGDLIPAKWCEPELDSAGKVLKLVVQYPYLDEVKKANGSWEIVAKVYRRVIDQERDIAYFPAEAQDDDASIKWKMDPERTLSHGFGFCPVVWYPFMKGCAAINIKDGKAIHDGLTDEIQAYDIARSQWHTTALYSAPQPYEIGVTADHNPTGTSGRAAIVPTTEHGGQSHPDGNPVRGAFVDPAGSKSARKKGPGYVWRYPDPDTKVGYLETSSDSVKAQSDNVSSLRNMLQESLCVVFLDPENIKFAATTSGKALEAIKKKQLDRVDQFREDFRDGFLIPSIAMQLRIARRSQINIPSAPVLSKIDPDQIEFDLEVQWGSYTAPDFAEQKQIVELVQQALGANGGTRLIDMSTALGKLQSSDVFEIENLGDLVEKLEAEAAESEAEERELLEIARGARRREEERPPADDGGGGDAAIVAPAPRSEGN